MREILFRGKRTETGKWISGQLARYNLRFDVANMVDEHEMLVPVLTKTIGQFTGLTDKNGKKIFEGDICKVGNLFYKVEFIYSCWWFTILSSKVYCCPAFDSHCGEYCEIIGNIHDNPELLENP